MLCSRSRHTRLLLKLVLDFCIFNTLLRQILFGLVKLVVSLSVALALIIIIIIIIIIIVIIIIIAIIADRSPLQ